MFVADGLRYSRHYGYMLDSKGLIAELERLKERRVTTNADLARLLNLPTSRIAEIFKGTRAVKIDEMKILVEQFGLEYSDGPKLNADMIEPLLEAIFPLLPPPGRMSGQSRKAVAEAIAYGFGLLGSHSATPASADAVAVASRAAASRFRELMN